LDRQCPSPKRDGSPCKGNVPPGKHKCWFHDEANHDKRRRIASKGGKSKKSRLSKDLHALLEDLTERVIDGELKPYPASVAGQLVGVRLRLLEYERKVKEAEVLEQRVEDLEALLERQKEQERGKRYAR
jgi:hypothetical protein